MGDGFPHLQIEYSFRVWEEEEDEEGMAEMEGGQGKGGRDLTGGGVPCTLFFRFGQGRMVCMYTRARYCLVPIVGSRGMTFMPFDWWWAQIFRFNC